MSRFTDQVMGALLAGGSSFDQHAFDLGGADHSHLLDRLRRLLCRGACRALTWGAVADQAMYLAKRSGSNAWVGVATNDRAREAQLKDRPGESLAQWIAEGIVTIESGPAGRVE